MIEFDITVPGSNRDVYAQYIKAKNEAESVIIIIPGGGYDHVSAREGMPVAKKFLAFGHDVIILHYSVAPARFPVQIKELSKCFEYLKNKNMKKYILGFSAGGHLAASYSMLWKEMFGGDSTYRPDGQILCYPVITSGEYAHRGSFENLLGSDMNEKTLDDLSLEKHINAGVPGTFIWHSVRDESVPAENSLLYAQALKKADVKFSLHIFSDGKHGIGLGTKESARDKNDICPECAQWTVLADKWIKKGEK